MKEIEKKTEDSIRELCQEEKFAVLATEGKSQPYASLVSFVTSLDLKYIAFATSKHTRKYSLLEENKRVAFVIDNRGEKSNRIDYISSITVTGKSKILTDPEEEKKWKELLTDKHPYLSDFVKSPEVAIIVVEVFRYFYVRRFQEVLEWIPK